MVPSPLAGEGQGEGVTNSLQNSIRLVSHWMILNTGSWAAMMGAYVPGDQRTVPDARTGMSARNMPAYAFLMIGKSSSDRMLLSSLRSPGLKVLLASS